MMSSPANGAASHEAAAEHRARGLLNLIGLAAACARLPGTGDAERAEWVAEAERARAGLLPLWPHLPHEVRLLAALHLPPAPGRGRGAADAPAA